MAGAGWDWFQREELIGHISDIRVQNLQVERENVQKRTFTRWVNLHLEKCCPPLEVKDLFVDIQDGRILMALLEVLTGHSLLHEYKSSSHRIFRLNNIAKALTFLEDSNVKLVSIDAAEIADGNPSLVLGLIWNIILFLQIKELTGQLSSMASSSSLSSLPTGTEDAVSPAAALSAEKSFSTSFKDQRKAIKALLSWVQQRTRKYGVAVQDFAGSWRSGLAFLAVIKAIDSSLVDMRSAQERSPRENLEDAFSIAQRSLSIPRLLELDDVMLDAPDEHSIMTYVTQFLEHFPQLDQDDFSDQPEDAPVEMTYVHYKDGPREEASKIITLPKKEDEDMDITVELQTRPLTPPQSHVYTEVHVASESKLNSEGRLSAPRRLFSGTSRGSAAKTDGGFNLARFPPQLETSPLNLNNAASNGLDRNLNGGGFGNTKVGASRGHEEPFLLSNGQGVLDRDHPDAGPPNSTVSGDKDQDAESILSRNSSKYSDSSSSFSSMSDRESTDLSSQSEGYQPGEDSPKPSPVSDDSGLVTPHEEGEDFKYILHLPNDHSQGDPTKQRTVFQAYRGGTEDRPHSTDSTGERPAEDTEGVKSSAKISVIPHDLFYYPHYSVPIADVLHAFADSRPDGVPRSRHESEASSDLHTDTTFSGDEDWEEGDAGNVDQPNQPALEGGGPQEDYTKPGSPAPPLNRTTSEPAGDTQGQSIVTRAAYDQYSQVPAQTGNPDPLKSRQGFADRLWDLEEELFRVAEGPAELAAVGGVTNLPFASNQSDRRSASRKEPELHEHSESGDLEEENTELYKHQTSALSNINGSSIFQKELGGLYHLGLLLWFLCYCALILPELDMDNVAFLVDDN